MPSIFENAEGSVLGKLSVLFASNASMTAEEFLIDPAGALYVEESTRKCLLGLESNNFPSTLHQFLQSGRVLEGLHACKRHSLETLYKLDLLETISVIPLSVATEDFAAWVQQIVLPNICNGDRHHATEKQGKTEYIAVIERVAMQLCDRAIASEKCTTRPFGAILYVELAKKCLDMSPCSQHISSECQSRIADLLPNLKLQAAILQKWNEQITLGDVVGIGLQGKYAFRL